MVKFFVGWRQMILLTLFTLLAVSAVAQEQELDPMAGKKLFNANCAACGRWFGEFNVQYAVDLIDIFHGKIVDIFANMIFECVI